MRVLITTLNSKYIHSNLALKYLYASAGDNSRCIELKEFTINNDEDYIFTEIMRNKYDAICFSCYVWNIERILSLAENIKKANWKTRIVVGGPEVSFETVEFLKSNPFIDIVISGEGEKPFAELIEALKTADSEFESIKGLTYRSLGKIYVNPKTEPMPMSEIPFPYLTLPIEEDKVLYYESTRGCPYRCSYCLSSVEKTMRSLDMGRVKCELDYFIFKKVRQVKFVDRTFNWDRNRAYELFSYMIGNDNGVTNFHMELCAELIDESLLQLLRSARKGLFQFEIGVQSVNPRTLEAVDRHSEFEKVQYAVQKLIAMGNAHIHLDLIAGLPHEDYASFRNSFNKVYALLADNLQLGFLKLLKGTPIRSQVEEFRYLYREKAPYEFISNAFMSSEEVVKLKMVENILDLYYNKGGFRDTLAFTTIFLAESPYHFYEEFANFFYLKGYQHRSHKKEDLYRIFLDYATWKERHQNGVLDKIQELLSSDMDSYLNVEAVKKFKGKGWGIH